jgi:16S rRNA (adenine1518-N6/adenine1519-N6)-dimethyltransferase
MPPKKSLGQNFLTSIPARIAIVASGNLSPSDTVLEVGPGKGFLTQGILDSGAHVVALEKDRDLLPILTEKFSSEIATGRFTLIEGDVLEFVPSEVPPQSPELQTLLSSLHIPHSTLHTLPSGYKLIANIPYYITGAILSHFLANTHQPSQMVVLVQKEVAERVVARDGKESILSLSVKAYGSPKLVYRVNKGSFNPIPTVDSAVLSIEGISRRNFKNQYHEQLFFTTVKSGFAHKRKYLISNLKTAFPTSDLQKAFEAVSLSDKVRAEDVTLATWLQLSLHIATHSSQLH